MKSIYGPHLCGDSLDMSADGSTILTGSWRPENPLELWDVSTGRLMEQVTWKDSLLASQPCLLYSAQLSKETTNAGRYIAAGGSGANEARVFDRLAGGGETALVGTVAGLARGVFTVDWSPTQDKVAIGAGDGTIRILEVAERSAEELESDQFARVVDFSSEQVTGAAAENEENQPPVEEKGEEL